MKTFLLSSAASPYSGTRTELTVNQLKKQMQLSPYFSSTRRNEWSMGPFFCTSLLENQTFWYKEKNTY